MTPAFKLLFHFYLQSKVGNSDFQPDLIEVTSVKRKYKQDFSTLVTENTEE